MANIVQIDSPEFEKFLKDLAAAPERVMPYAVKAMDVSVTAVKSEMAQYPPETEANHPGRFSIKTRRPLGYYERGRGWWEPIVRSSTLQLAGRLAGAGQGSGRAKYSKSLGVIKARRQTMVAGYKLRPVSETLGKRWMTDVRTGETYVIGVIGNNASYAGHVQGPAQARHMEALGWQNVTKGTEAAMPTIEAAFTQQVDQYLKDLANGTDANQT